MTVGDRRKNCSLDNSHAKGISAHGRKTDTGSILERLLENKNKGGERSFKVV